MRLCPASCRTRSLLPACLLAICSAPALAPGSALASEKRRTATVRVVEQAGPSIVNIHGQKTLTPNDDGYRQGDQPQKVNGMGTGVVIDERGYIITNHHVVDGVKRIAVTFRDGQTYTATLVSFDHKTDLAIIKIDPKDRTLDVIDIGTSGDLMIGEPVIAMGNAFGYENTVTRGIVSALHRTVQVSDNQSYRDLIQVDAAINPGNSGGPLLNVDGEMIGINVAVRAGAQGIGFAIPVDMAMSIAADLMSTARLTSTWHGVIARSESGETNRELVVDDVEADSPAAHVGLQAGDAILAVDDQKISRPLDLERRLLGRKSGDAVVLTLRRGDDTKTVSLTLASASKGRPTVSEAAWTVLGLKFEPVDEKQIRKINSRYHGGLRITAVRPGSPAAKQGMTRGDILVGIHVWETVSPDNVQWVLDRPDIQKLDPVKFYILRGSETLWGRLSVNTQR